MLDTTPHPPPDETRNADLAIGQVTLDGLFEGYASLFGREDMSRDVVLPGAFRDSLSTLGPAGIRMLWQHDPAQPIGVWLRMYEDARGLYVRGRLATETARGREALALLRARALDGLSIGFRPVRARRDRTGVRRLERVDLWEVSVVTFPMQPGARVTHVRQAPRVALRDPAPLWDPTLLERVGRAARLLKSANRKPRICQ
jgi:hypothetical protein